MNIPVKELIYCCLVTSGVEKMGLQACNMEKNKEYYGHYDPIVSTRPRRKTVLCHQIKRGIQIGGLLVSMTLICFNSYLLMKIKDDLKKVDYRFYELFKSADESTFLIRSDVRPKVDLISQMLSYQLPNAILAAFKKSNVELTNSLGDITFNLENLVELYRSLLGFDDEWMITPNTQHLTCSLVPSDKIGEVYEQMLKRKRNANEDDNQSLNVNPILDREYPDYNDYITPPNHHKPSIERKRKIVVKYPEGRTFFSGIMDIIKEKFGVNESSVYIPERFRQWSQQSIITRVEHESPSLSSMTSKNETEEEDTVIVTTTPPPKVRKRRFAADFIQKKDLENYMKRYSDNVMIKVHTVKNTVSDVCSMTKKILNFPESQCPITTDLVQFIGCLLGDLKDERNNE